MDRRVQQLHLEGVASTVLRIYILLPNVFTLGAVHCISLMSVDLGAPGQHCMCAMAETLGQCIMVRIFNCSLRPS